MASKKLAHDNVAGWAFVLPAFLFLFIFMIYPILHTLYYSFHTYNFVFDDKPVFNGIGNFIEILKQETFLKAIANTFYFTLVYIPAMFVLGFLAGMVLARNDLWGSKAAKIVLFIPMVIPLSMSSMMFLFILNAQWGLVNSIFRDFLHIPFLVRDWMNNPSTAFNMIIIVTIWQRIGFIGLLFMAGIQALPKSMQESAIIDGAGAWRRVTSIILPNLRSTYMVVGILSIIQAIKLFAQVVAMTGANNVTNAGGPANATLTMYVATWKASFVNFDMGLGSAMGYFMSFIIIILFGVNFFLTREERS